ncbi:MAG: hypothetical protein LBP55_06110 [Candidatus Adiutrix sp.]|jgi:hypothetical protein|nr:hypothetical protein [Candidatus Adiutrix sp.]
MLSLKKSRVAISSALLAIWLTLSLILPALAQAYAQVCAGQASCCSVMADVSADHPVAPSSQPLSPDQSPNQANSPCPLKLGSQYVAPLLVSPIQMTLLATEPATATQADDEPRGAMALNAIFHPPR